MSLKLGKSFDRNYNIRLPFMNGFYNIGVFFNRKSTFLLFSVDPSLNTSDGQGVKINMYKNLESSKFCETFLELHNYRGPTLDIVSQFKEVKADYFHEVSFILNESLVLSKVEIDDDKTLFDCLNIYGFTLNSYMNEFIYLITERQNVVKKINRKIVRSSGIQLATSSAMKMLNDYHQESLTSGKVGIERPVQFDSNIKNVIRLDDNGD
jgi:hypothetical protein